MYVRLFTDLAMNFVVTRRSQKLKQRDVCHEILIPLILANTQIYPVSRKSIVFPLLYPNSG